MFTTVVLGERTGKYSAQHLPKHTVLLKLCYSPPLSQTLSQQISLMSSTLSSNFLYYLCFCVPLLVTLWTIAHQAPLSMGFSKQEYWNGLPLPPSDLIPKPFKLLQVKFIGMLLHTFSSVQFSPVTQSCPTLCNPMNRSMPGLPVHQNLPEFTQTHVHRVGDAI